MKKKRKKNKISLILKKQKKYNLKGIKIYLFFSN
jgi:hypothetical protein